MVDSNAIDDHHRIGGVQRSGTAYTIVPVSEPGCPLLCVTLTPEAILQTGRHVRDGPGFEQLVIDIGYRTVTFTFFCVP